MPGSTLLFLHGYGLAPDREYRRFLRGLVPAHVRVIAPYLYNNNRLEKPPTTLEACVGLTRAAVAEEPGPFVVVGHSTGGLVALLAFWSDPRVERIVACNPVVPVSYGFWQFFRRGVQVGCHQLLGRTAPFREGWRHFLVGMLPYYANFLRRPRASRALIEALASFRFRTPEPTPTPSPGRYRLLHSTLDEFFDYDRDWPDWLQASEPVVARVPVAGHEWVIVRPEAAELVRTHLPDAYR